MSLSPDDKPPNAKQEMNIAVGPPIVGGVLTTLIAWSLYTGQIDFAMLAVVLLVALAIATAIINKL